MFFYFQILVLFIVATMVGALPKRGWLVIFLAIIMGFFVTLQFVSIKLGGDLIDYRFYEHINLKDIWSLKDFFAAEFFVFALVFLIICTLLYFISKWLRSKTFSKWMLTLAILAGVLIMFLPNGALSNIYSIINLKTAKTASFNEALKDLGIDPLTYVTSDEITATPGKNIIVISLESLERGYLEPPLENLTPNLREFAKEHTYIKMEQSLGSTWTSASMYTVLTGLPSYFKTPSNEIFQGSDSYKASNLGDVLKTAGYNMSYLITKKEFSGMDNLLSAFHFKVSSETDFTTQYEKTHWGIPDKDLFEETKKEITLQSKKNEPFAIFLSTISGHFPNGVYDKRMEPFLPKQDTHLEFMTSAVDLYVGQLIQFLKDKNLFQDTVVYIFPDHELMGTSSKVLKKFKNERGLYIITNADSQQVKENLHEPITQIDMPRIILNGSGIKTNATFLTDYIKDSNKEQFIRKNQKTLLALNEASLQRSTFNSGFSLVLKDDGNVEMIAHNGNHKVLLPKISEKTLYNIYFQNDMRYIRTEEVSQSTKLSGFTVDRYSKGKLENTFKIKETPTIIFSVVQDSLFGYFRNNEFIGIAHSGEKEISFLENELTLFKDWKILQTGRELNEDKIFLKSTGYTFISNYGHSRIFTGLKPYKITRGLNILFIQNNKYKVANFDTYANPDDAIEFMALLKQLLKSKNDFAIVAHDSADEQLKLYSDELSGLGFKVLSNLETREAYIGYYQNGNLKEQKDGKSITIELNKKNLPSDPAIEKRKKDTLRFIAHAGGGINGDTYTNSLEALNLNYNKGFRLFELDIIKTSDNVFVSAHDWNQWSKKTKYKGTLPPTNKVFLENPIKEYTPMDIDKINLWFKEHPDAILVTDKVNTPKEFASKFIDKNRLMMELFSAEALKEAIDIGIDKAMASENVLRTIRGKEVETLQKWGIKYVAVSRRIMIDKLAMFIELKEANIKTYVFHVNSDEGRDETFVVENEMDYIYGMYADEWNFSK